MYAVTVTFEIMPEHAEAFREAVVKQAENSVKKEEVPPIRRLRRSRPPRRRLPLRDLRRCSRLSGTPGQRPFQDLRCGGEALADRQDGRDLGHHRQPAV